MNKNKRDTTIDILRVIGLLLIFCAHANIPKPYFLIRIFDVVLLVFCSGMSFAYSSFEFNKKNYIQYVIKRLIRMVLPVWIFLTFFYLVFVFIFHQSYTNMEIITSYLLVPTTLGYIWIFRIYCSIAILLPLFKKVVEKTKPWMIVGTVILVLLLNDASYQYLFKNSSIWIYGVTYTVGYLSAGILGMLNHRLSTKERIIYGVLFLAITLAYGILLGNFQLDKYKYPPEFFYVSYGLGMSFLLYVIFSYVKIELPIVTWISKNSLMIYIWHIFFAYLMEYKIITVPDNLFIHFVLLLIPAIFMTWLMNLVLSKFKS